VKSIVSVEEMVSWGRGSCRAAIVLRVSVVRGKKLLEVWLAIRRRTMVGNQEEDGGIFIQ
jgi:hypothetical protein